MTPMNIEPTLVTHPDSDATLQTVCAGVVVAAEYRIFPGGRQCFVLRCVDRRLVVNIRTGEVSVTEALRR